MSTVSGIAGARPLVITGMHRSGTSLLASLLAGAGLSVGSRLIGASRGNDRGHWEDLDFYEFHVRALEANGVASEGFACSDHLLVPAEMREDAATLVGSKAAAGHAWGWKDPRTTLFLEFWHDVLPEAAYVFVFRSPWEVADSLFRRGDPIFARNPALAVRIWLHYNRRVRDFCLAHRERCVLVSVTQVATDPAAVLGVVRGRFDLPLGEAQSRYEAPLLLRDDCIRRQEIVAALEPEAPTLYAEMLRLAGTAGSDQVSLRRTDRGSIAEHAITEWSRAAASVATAVNAARVAAESEARELGGRLSAIEREKQSLEGRMRELQARADELALHVERLALGRRDSTVQDSSPRLWRIAQ